MPTVLSPTASLTSSFLEVLHPIGRQVEAERTLSPGKLGIMRHLAKHGRATATELAAAIQVSPQGVSLAVREMERLQLVTRLPDAEDRRKAWIVMTDAGTLKLAQESAAGFDSLHRALVERLSPPELEALAAAIPILRKIGSGVGRHD